MIGHLVAQPMLIVHRDLEKLGKIVRPDQLCALQHSLNALLHPEGKQSCKAGVAWKLETTGEPVSDERSRKAVGQTRQLLLLGRVRHAGNRRNGLDQTVRHDYRSGVGRRLAQIADLVNFFRLRGGGIEDGLGYPHEITGVAPDSHDTLSFFMAEARTHLQRILQQTLGKDGDRKTQMRRAYRRAPGFVIPVLRIVQQGPDSSMYEANARGELPAVVFPVQTAGKENVHHVAVVLLQASGGR